MPRPKVKTAYPGQPERKRKRVAIVGYTTHRLQAPFSDPDWDIWFLNDLHHELPKIAPVDRLRFFQLHSWHDAEAWAPERPVNEHPLDANGGPVHGRDHGYVAMLADWAKKIPVYLMEERPEVPGAILLPRDALYDLVRINGEPCRYYTNSISWMLGMAILEGYEEIGLYGVDMMMAGGEGSEYGYQRPSCELFLGVAAGKGIKVHLPQESDLLKTLFVYGDRDEAPFRKNLRHMETEYQQRSAQLSQQKAGAENGLAELRGALNVLAWIQRSHMPGDTGDGHGMLPEPNAHKGVLALPKQEQPKPEQVQPNGDQIVAALANMENYLGPRAALIDKLLKERYPQEVGVEASDSARAGGAA